MAQEYIQSGKVVVINNWIHLPNGQPIRNNIFGRNLQAKIDAWISGTIVATSTHRPEASFTSLTTLPHTRFIVLKSLKDPMVKQYSKHIL